MLKHIDVRKLSGSAMAFVIVAGIADFFADMTYEGARSITGPFLGSLGATATIIGIAIGFGEMIGYLLRAASGLWLDRSRRYWLFALLGYTINMLAVPALALAGNWIMAVILIVIERAGRAIRKPAMETMISYTSSTIGRGWVFGLNTALDQAGATFGPLIVAAIMLVKHDYHISFAYLFLPGLCCLAIIFLCSFIYSNPADFAPDEVQKENNQTFSKAYWLYVVAGSLVAAGFADFALIAYHFQKVGIFSIPTIPILYALAMGSGAMSGLIFGKLLDKIGFVVIIVSVICGSLFAPLVFSNSYLLAVIGSCLWGIGKVT